jgi:hypothetical protein
MKDKMENKIKSKIISKIQNLKDDIVLYEIDTLLKIPKKMSFKEYKLKISNAEKDILANNLYTSEEIANLIL